MEKTEIRKCINCGKEFSVNISKNRSTSKQQLFCSDCISSLTNWERKVIKMNKFPEIRNLYLQQKRNEFLRGYIKQILARTKKRAKCKNIDGERLYLELKKRGILVRHFTKAEICQYNRITIGNIEQMQKLIEAITLILEENG